MAPVSSSFKKKKKTEIFLGVKEGQSIRLSTSLSTSLPTMSQLSEKCGSLNVSQP
jgi:hypothetical protein